jgi:hypothetical protein
MFYIKIVIRTDIGGIMCLGHVQRVEAFAAVGIQSGCRCAFFSGRDLLLPVFIETRRYNYSPNIDTSSSVVEEMCPAGSPWQHLCHVDSRGNVTKECRCLNP